MGPLPGEGGWGAIEGVAVISSGKWKRGVLRRREGSQFRCSFNVTTDRVSD